MTMLISAVAAKLVEAEERASTGTIVLFFVGFLFAVTCLVVMT